MSFWGELKRRNVVKVAVAYGVVSWLLIQVADTLFPALQLPAWTVTFVAALLVLGFPVALLLSWAYELTPEGIKKTNQVPVEESVTHVTGQKLNYIVTGLLVLAVAFMAIDTYVLGGANEPGAAQQAPALASEPSPREAPPPRQTDDREALANSVAVLPFENLSPDPDNAYFAAGMHEEILNQLAKLSNLNVISRTTMLQYAEQRKALPEIARELNVETVMEGSVRYAGNRIRVTMQLIDATTDQHLWSETYEREFDDVFAIESDIAMNVANALEAEFSEEEQQRIERPPTDSSVAYALLLQAMNLIGVGAQVPRMHELLEQAIAIDPEFARAYGLQAQIYAQETINTTEASARSWAELEPLVRENANAALALDPSTDSALGALGNLASYSWHWTEATDAYERAFENGVSSDNGGASLWFLAWSGRADEAVTLAERSVALDPLSWRAHWVHGMALNYAGDYRAAAEAARKGIAQVPILSLQHSWLAMSEIARGNVDEARRELERAEQLLGANRAIISLLDIAYGYGRIGDRDNARRLFEEITTAANGGQDIGAGGWALANLAIGDEDEALDWLERGADKASRHEPDAGFYSLMNLRMNFTADPLLERAEFVDVRNRLRGD